MKTLSYDENLLISEAFIKRPLDLYKYTSGVVTIVGGSTHYPNAPVLAALGARTGGAGLVQLVVPDSSRIASSNLVPEATFTKQTPTCIPPPADVMVIGMGLTVSPNSEMLLSRLLSGSNGHFVLDADALSILANWYAKQPQMIPANFGTQTILTPHEGEAARLLACSVTDIHHDRLAALKQLVQRYHSTVILKGQHTLVASPNLQDNTFTYYECSAGNPFMALGGMGDLLSGIVGAHWAYLIKQGMSDPFKAAASAVWLHASASDSLINDNPPIEPSVVATAQRVASIRIKLER